MSYDRSPILSLFCITALTSVSLREYSAACSMAPVLDSSDESSWRSGTLGSHRCSSHRRQHVERGSIDHSLQNCNRLLWLRRPQIVSGVPIASSAAYQGFYTWAGRSILGRTRGTHEDHSLFRLKAAPPRVQYASCSEKRTPG